LAFIKGNEPLVKTAITFILSELLFPFYF
jgi:hypothetical protein